MNELKAIETSYKGYRFRSRTEARWAVFLEWSGILKWEYEKEGFDLPSGYYLPDFWIEYWEGETKKSIWMEVKGEIPDELSRECRLCQELCIASGQEVILVCGTPSLDPLYHFTPNGYRYGTIADFWNDRSRTDYAIEEARSARFEHGETP